MGKKILIVGPSWLGDMVMAQALFRLLHSRGDQLDVLAPEWNFAVLERMPEINKAIPMPIDHGELKIAERIRIGKSLRNHHYDQAIVLPNSLKSAIIPWAAKIPVRTGWARECRFLLMNDVRKLDKVKYPLMVQRFVALGYGADDAWDINDYPLPKLEVNPQSVKEKLEKHQLQVEPQQPVLALAAGAAFGDTKRWPASYYGEIANKKIDEGWQVWLFGSPKDKEVTAEIQQLTNGRCRDLAGQLKLDETVDLISQVTVIVSNDSGLLHVAAALQRPIVAIYGSTSPEFTPPLTKDIHVLQTNIECRPCFQRTCKFGHLKCLTEISTQSVMDAINGFV